MQSSNNYPVTEVDVVKLSRRRERGKLAQRAYRQRQVHEIESLQARVRSLQDAIRRINKKTNHLEASLQFLNEFPSSVLEAKTMVELQRRHLREALDEALKLSESKVWEEKRDEEEQQLAEKSASLSPPEPPNTVAADAVHPPPLEEAHSSLGQESPTQMTDLTMAPSLDTPLYLPQDIVPYLYSDRRTFAGALFWRSMVVAYSHLQNLPYWNFDYSQSQNNNGPGSRARMFSISFRYDNADSIRRRISTRLKLRKTVIADSFHGYTGDDGSIRLHQHVLQDLANGGRSVDQYLDPREVENRLWQFCKDQSNTNNHEQNSAFIGNTNFLAPASRGFFQSLIDTLAHESDCFGDGPRFRVEVVNSTLQKIMNAGLPTAQVSEILNFTRQGIYE